MHKANGVADVFRRQPAGHHQPQIGMVFRKIFASRPVESLARSAKATSRFGIKDDGIGVEIRDRPDNSSADWPAFAEANPFLRNAETELGRLGAVQLDCIDERKRGCLNDIVQGWIYQDSHFRYLSRQIHHPITSPTGIDESPAAGIENKSQSISSRLDCHE